MSAFATQSDPEEGQSTFGTRDPALAATLGNFGFQALHSLPVLLVVDAAAVVDLVNKNTGRVGDCAHLEFRFEATIMHEVFGRLSASDISAAFAIAKLAQKEQTKDITASERLTLTKLRDGWKGRRIGPDGVNHAGTLLWSVQLCYDQVTNFLIVCNVVKELARNPLISFSQQVFQGVAYAIEPAEQEPVAARRSERLFKNARK